MKRTLCCTGIGDSDEDENFADWLLAAATLLGGRWALVQSCAGERRKYRLLQIIR
jgi:hypothetical protein